MTTPPRPEAMALLADARHRNPTPWVDHALNVARAAEAIARRVNHLDPETAFVLGALHDIGRREGVTGMRHILDGYRFLDGLGHAGAARICLTHSFPIEDLRHTKTSAGGEAVWDCTAEELAYVNGYLASVEYDDYDRLIQLCDSLALPTRVCTLEERFVDVTMRHGCNEYTVPRWRAYLQLKDRFESLMGCSLGAALAGVSSDREGDPAW